MSSQPLVVAAPSPSPPAGGSNGNDPQADKRDRFGVSHVFHVKLDPDDFGLWTSCTGLSAKYQVETYEEGGQNGFVHKLPGRLTFENVKLKRAVDEQSGAVAAYFTRLAHKGTAPPVTAVITLYDTNRHPIAAWHLSEVVPVSWTGPQFGTGKGEVAQEEVELAHHGFTYGKAG